MCRHREVIVRSGDFAGRGSRVAALMGGLEEQ